MMRALLIGSLCLCACDGPRLVVGSLDVRDAATMDASVPVRDAGDDDADDDDDDMPCDADVQCVTRDEPYCHPDKLECEECVRDEQCADGEYCDDGECESEDRGS